MRLGSISGPEFRLSSCRARLWSIYNASQTLAQGATQQASSFEETTSTMNLIAEQTRQSRVPSEVKAAAEDGDRQMQEMVDAMSVISESGQSVSKIIKVIDEIAFQANLLALNAAVEAARAGQHGKLPWLPKRTLRHRESWPAKPSIYDRCWRISPCLRAALVARW